MKFRLLAVAAIGLAATATPALAKDIVVKMNTKGPTGAYAFQPAFVKAAVGDRVRYVPSDPTHNAELMKGAVPAGVAVTKGAMGKEFVVNVTKPGLYGVECLPHRSMGMVGLIQAGNGPSPNKAALTAVKLPPLAQKRMTAMLAQAK